MPSSRKHRSILGYPSNASGWLVTAGVICLGAVTALHAGQVSWLYTESPTELRAETGKLGGFLKTGDQPGMAWFEWGPPGRMTNRTPVVPLQVGQGLLRVTARITYNPDALAARWMECRLVAGSNAASVTAVGTVRRFTAGAKLVAWGSSAYGVPNVPPGSTNVVYASLGYGNGAEIRANGAPVIWGSWSYGQTNIPADFTNIIALACGGTHAAGLSGEGRVLAWGTGTYGQNRVPSGLAGVVALAVGQNHNVALKSDGRVVAWGDNYYQQTNAPVGLENVVAISAAGSGHHTLALLGDGRVVSWGRNSSGQTNVPAGLNGVVAVAAGGSHSLALTASGTVLAWGNNDYGQTTVPAGLGNVVGIAAGATHSMALLADGTVVAWGDSYAQGPDLPATLVNVVSIAAGRNSSMAFGRVNPPPRANAQVLPALPNAPSIVQLSGSDPFNDPITFKITSMPRYGALFQFTTNTNSAAWIPIGLNDRITDSAGRLIYVPERMRFETQQFSFAASDGESDSPPATITLVIERFLSAFTEPADRITESNAMLHGLMAPNGLPTKAWFEWGPIGAETAPTNSLVVYDGDGREIWRRMQVRARLPRPGRYFFRLVVTNELGRVEGMPRFFTTGSLPAVWGGSAYYSQTNTASISNATTVASGVFHMLSVSSSGRVDGWGWTSYGLSRAPSELAWPAGIAAGTYHNLVLRSNGTVFSWGANQYGITNVPVGLSNVVAVAAGAFHSVALKDDGQVEMWGNGSYGQMNKPVGLHGVVAIAAGGNHTLALRADGTVVAWGDNTYGQINVPAGLNGVVAIAAGDYISMALQANGCTRVWGVNWEGQSTPPASAQSGVVGIAAGSAHCLALKQDGCVVAWGRDCEKQVEPPAQVHHPAMLGGGYEHSVALLPPAPPTSRVCVSNLATRFYPTDGSTTITNNGATLRLLGSFVNLAGLDSVEATITLNLSLYALVFDANGTQVGLFGPLASNAPVVLPDTAMRVDLFGQRLGRARVTVAQACVRDYCRRPFWLYGNGGGSVGSTSEIDGAPAPIEPASAVVNIEFDGVSQHTFTGLNPSQRYLTVVNGAPGVRWIDITLNGHCFRLDSLADGGTVSADLSAAMRAADNLLQITAVGSPGSSAVVTVTDAASGQARALPEIVRLSMARCETGLELSWPQALSGWRLQSSAVADGDWADVEREATMDQGRFVLSVPVVEAARFYRLRPGVGYASALLEAYQLPDEDER